MLRVTDTRSPAHLLVRGLSWLLLPLVAAVLAAQPPEEDFRKLAAEWDRTLKSAESRLEQPGVGARAADDLRERIDSVRSQAQAQGRAAKKKADEMGALLESLGPAPAEGAPPEAADVQKKREQLNGALADLSGQVKQCDLTITRSEALLRQISAAQFERRTTDLLVRSPLPLTLATWTEAGGELLAITRQIHAREVVGGEANLVILPLVAIAIYVAVALGRALRRSIRQRYGRDPSISTPSYGRRLIAAVLDGVSRGLVPVLVIVVLLSAAWWLFVERFVDPSVGAPLSLLYAITFYLLVAALVRAAFSPELPNWRVMPIAAEASAKLGYRLNLLAAVFAADMAVSPAFERFGEPPDLATIHSLIRNALLAVLVLSLLRTKLWQVEAGSPEWFEEHPRIDVPAVSSYIRFLIGLVAVVALGCNLLGYAAVADHLLRAMILTMLMVGAMFALRFILREAFGQLLAASTGPAVAIKRALALSEHGSRLISFWVVAGIDLLLVTTGILLGLVLWGIPPREVTDWLYGVFSGFSIGSYHFSLADVLLALAAFATILIVTRLLQRFLEFRLLPNTRLDIGIRTAITSGIGYLGAGVALLAAISTLGISLTGLAVVAGAFSLGIAFGLQNIVNNFISGIILLIERPVKVGDSVVVKEHEGVVRRIKVRSTEIETGQHASVIIPNADLLQTAVVNWTYRDRIGRVEIRLTLPYGADAEQVEALLLDCARRHPKVVRHPEPAALLVNFNDRGAEFQLSFQLGDIDEKGRVASDVRKAILVNLHAAGIEIPSAQGRR